MTIFSYHIVKFALFVFFCIEFEYHTGTNLGQTEMVEIETDIPVSIILYFFSELNFARKKKNWSKFSRVLSYFGLYLRFLTFFKGAIQCASCVQILFDHCTLVVLTITFIFMGMSLPQHKYNALWGFWKIGDITKMTVFYPQMK